MVELVNDIVRRYRMHNKKFLIIISGLAGLLVGVLMLTRLKPYFPAIRAYLALSQPPKVAFAHAAINTSIGVIELELYKDTPRNTANFINLSESGFYNQTKFHRSIPGLLIQGGDPLSMYDTLRGQWGKGGPGYTVPDEELHKRKMERGIVAMANTGPNSNGSQFFILTATRSAFLDGRNTIFGKVVGGMEIVDVINKLPTSITEIPLNPVVIQSINVY